MPNIIQKVVKLSVSLPKDVLEWIDRQADNHRRSHGIAYALAELRKRSEEGKRGR